MLLERVSRQQKNFILSRMFSVFIFSADSLLLYIFFSWIILKEKENLAENVNLLQMKLESISASKKEHLTQEPRSKRQKSKLL